MYFNLGYLAPYMNGRYPELVSGAFIARWFNRKDAEINPIAIGSA